jgi:AmmeMemoRadiSam system protein B/AmmeMemoRadiSam system protein A
LSAIRPAAVAGAFYPSAPAQLQRQIADFFGGSGSAGSGPVPKALIAPHAGYIYSGPVAAAAYARLASARGRITRVVLLGPSHFVGFHGQAASSAEGWQTPLGTVPIDRAVVERLVEEKLVGVLDAAHAREHSLEVQIPFLQQALGGFALVPIVAGDAPPEAVAALLDAVWGGPETLIVISTDLSHYLDYRSCQEIDSRTASAIERFDWDALGPESACGRVPLRGLLAAAKRRSMSIARLDLRNSGDTAGPRDRVVGYGSWALFEPADQEREEIAADEPALAAVGSTLIELACASIAYGLTEGCPKPVAVIPGLPAVLAAPGAVFVTLHRNGQLRGCVGSVIAQRPLIADVADNAFKAAFKDPRFPPLRPDELDGLDLSIALLTQPAPMRFVDEPDLLAQLRPTIDGLIIEDGSHRALFLPAMWRHLPDPRQFLHHLKQKAGLDAEHWSPAFRASRFRTAEIRQQPPNVLRVLLRLASRHQTASAA